LNAPKLGDPVTIDGVDGVLVVVGVDARGKIAKVYTRTTPRFLYTLPWSGLSYVEQNQNAGGVRDASEGRVRDVERSDR
jgi:hypothetical protein